MKTDKITRRFRIRHRKKLIVCGVILVVWVIIMLTLSSQNGLQTAQLSGRFSEWLTLLIYGENLEKFHAVHLFVRKAAHVFLFMVLSTLLAEILICFERAKPIICAAVSVGAAVMFALADEWHKLYIPGIHFEVVDVMLNIIGILLGAAIFLLIRFVCRRRKTAKAEIHG